jgi:outer membrane protein OmpA-like peptidoglycan-associated protein
MSINVLDLAKSYFNNSVIDRLSALTGENSSNIKSAIGSILPALLGGIMQRASTTPGANEVMNLVNEQHVPSLLDNLPDFLGDNKNTQNLLSTGEALVPSILGSRANLVMDSIGSSTGLKTSSVSSLISLSAPILLNIIGAPYKSSGMGLSGLTSMLMEQKESVLSALPAGLLKLLNFTDLGDFKGNQKNSVPERQDTNESSSSSWLPWILALLALLAITWGVKTCQKEKIEPMVTEEIIDSTTTKVTDTFDSLTAKVESGLEKLGAFFKRKLPNGVELNIPELGIENNLIKFIEDSGKPVDKTTWFNFDRITFETGSARLGAQSLEQIKNLAEILKAYPNTNLKVGGYTDNTGDSAINLKLSTDRANAVKAAIEQEGITKDRIEAEGYGKEYPVASNETEEGRAMNRRIAVRVTKK